MEILEFLRETTFGRMLLTAAVSMIPVVELRGGIPFGAALGLAPWQALCAGVVGNMIPIPFIIVYIRKIFKWLREHIPRLGRMVDALEQKAHLKGEAVTKYGAIGLYLFVSIPLPGTGGWTGALAAAFLDIRLKRAIPSIFLGILTAGIIMTFLTGAVVSVIR